MSKITTRSFTCPHCHNEGEFTMYDSVNVDLNPELREKVLSGEVFEWKCPKCGTSMHVMYDLLYHDMKHEFMIYFSPNNCTGTKEQVNDMLEKYPGMRHGLYRTTEELNRLREKILILEEGFNDIAIELAKVLIKYNKDNKIPSDADLFFERYLKTEDDVSKSILIFRIIKDGKPQDGMAILPKEGYDNYLSAVNREDRFKMTNCCDTIDESWIMNRLKMEQKQYGR